MCSNASHVGYDMRVGLSLQVVLFSSFLCQFWQDTAHATIPMVSKHGSEVFEVCMTLHANNENDETLFLLG